MPYKPAFIQVFEDRGLKKILKSIIYNEAVNAGSESKPIVVWVKNITGYELENVRIISSDRECLPNPQIISHMNPSQVVKVTFVWKPSLTRESPLSVSISAKANLIKRA